MVCAKGGDRQNREGSKQRGAKEVKTAGMDHSLELCYEDKQRNGSKLEGCGLGAQRWE